MDFWVRLRLPALLLLLVASGLGASLSAPEAGYIAGIWPVGLATGIVLLAPRRREPLLLAAVFTIALVSVALVAQPLDVSFGYAVAVTAAAWLAARMLTGQPGGVRGELNTDRDLNRWLMACAASAGLGGAVVALTAWIVGIDNPVLVGLGAVIAYFASQLLFTPFFLQPPNHGAVAQVGERITQWVVLIVVAMLLLWSAAAPGLIFLTIPFLAWGALRITSREALLQLVGVVTFAVVLTPMGRGPFPRDPENFGVPVEIRGVLLSGFTITCAVIVVPLMVRVAQYMRAAREADAERYLVTNIVDSARGVAIIVTDEVGRIVRFNSGAEHLLGYSAEEVMGGFTPFLHTEEAIAEAATELGTSPDYASVVLALVEEPEGTLIRFARRDGVERTHSTTVSQLNDRRGRTTGYLSTSEDVTDAIATEEALRATLAAEQEAVERLQAVDAVKDTFVSTVSHELRTPLTSIIGFLELLSDGSLGGLDPKQLEALLRVTANSHRLLSLIDDLLTLSKVAEHGVQAIHTVFDLREAVREASAVVAPICVHPRDLELVLDLPADQLALEGDRDMIERVVLNLLSNAVKFTPDGGTIHVEMEQRGADALLRVRDSGIGIPEKEQSELFTRFFRSSLSQGNAIPGSGLGLSITRAIVERHRGSIGLSSTPDVGTSVEVALPLFVGNVQDSTMVLMDENRRHNQAAGR